MSYNLPPHLQALNSTHPSPPSQMSKEAEDSLWDYLHTDDLYRNFGSNTNLPNTTTNKPEYAALPLPTPAASPVQPADLKSFIAQFAPEATAGSFNPAHLNFAGIEASAMGLGSISTLDVLPGLGAGWTGVLQEDSLEDGRISGAKKLKSIGAGPAEIEEDKRRRNTEASARFRLKKKEREQALDSRAKELEAQVAQLAAEKASLEKENSLLKAIVLNSQAQLKGTLDAEAAGGKRKRE